MCVIYDLGPAEGERAPLTIQYRQTPTPKLTLAMDETRVKIPVGMEPVAQARIFRFCEWVAEQVRPRLTQTLRSRILVDTCSLSVKLKRNNGHIVASLHEAT